MPTPFHSLPTRRFGHAARLGRAPRRRLAAFWVIGLACTVLGSGSGLAQDSGDEKAFRIPSWQQRLSDPVYLAWLEHPTVGTCVDCHLSPPITMALGNREKVFGTFSRRDEMERWLTRDKHTIARRRVEPFPAETTAKQFREMLVRMYGTAGKIAEELRQRNQPVDLSKTDPSAFMNQWIGPSNVLSRRICDTLYGDGAVETDEGYATFRDQCLTCHGGYESGQQGFELSDVSSGQIGIDCNHCHANDESDAWVIAHQDPKTWRLKTAEAKTKAGMADMVSTVTQAKMCMDCHVGNRDRDMFVTHAMYAAGHPPLPPIELEEYCRETPQHWQPPDELFRSLANYDGREQYFQLNYPPTRGTLGGDEVFWDTRKMLIGAIQARVQTLDLYSQSIQKDQWGDYSLYDCSACHHELRHGDGRQDRYELTPGRPRPSEWLMTVYETALLLGQPEQAAKARQLEAELLEAFDKQPFGVATSVDSVSQRLTDVLDQILQFAAARPINDDAAGLVIRRLTQTSEQDVFTYDSCRMLAWSIQTVADELDAAERLDPVARQQVRDLVQASGLLVDLPAGREKKIYRDSLQRDLELRKTFEPAEFVRKLRALSRTLFADGRGGASAPGTSQAIRFRVTRVAER